MTVDILFHRVGTVGSTNDVALELAHRGEPEGTIVLADRQLSGRGRRGRVWQDEPDQSILMSALLRPRLPISELPKLSFVASLAVAEWLAYSYGLQAKLKWPNDVLIGSRKVSGILVELASSPQGPAAVVGIGVNINQQEFAGDIADLATSVSIETARLCDAALAAESMAAHLIQTYERFIAAGFEEILSQWRKRMWGVGEAVEISTENGTLNGNIRGVDSEGALLVVDAAGASHSIHAADAIKTTRELRLNHGES